MNVIKNWLGIFDKKVSYRLVGLLNGLAVLACSANILFFLERGLLMDLNMILVTLNGIFMIFMLYMYDKHER